MDRVDEMLALLSRPSIMRTNIAFIMCAPLPSEFFQKAQDSFTVSNPPDLKLRDLYLSFELPGSATPC